MITHKENIKSAANWRNIRCLAGVVVLSAVLFHPGQAAAIAYASSVSGTSGQYTVEYDNLRELLKQGNLQLKKSIDDYEENVAAYQEIWDTLKWEQSNMEDKAEYMEDGDQTTAGVYASNASMLKSSARRIYSQLDTLTSDKSTRSLEKSADAYTMSAQTLMNSYNQMVQNIEAARKNVEALRAARDAAGRQNAAGSLAQAQVDSAENRLIQAENSLASLTEQALELRQKLLTMLGIADSGTVTIGPVSQPDMAAIEAIDFETDQKKAVGSDSSVQSQRHAKALGSAAVNRRFKLVDEAEGTAVSDFTAAYQDLLAQKTAYEAALQSHASALLTYQALQRKQQAGLLSNVEYLQGEADYQQKKAAKEIAAMNLVQAYEAYCWEIKGV